MKKKLEGLIALTTVLMVSVSMLGGCKSKSLETSASDKASTSTNTKGVEGKVVLWSMWNNNEPQAKVINDAIADFKAANPKAEVAVQWDGRDVKKLVKPALDGGEAIDIWEGDPAIYIKTVKDNMLKLDDKLSQPAIGMNGKSVNDSLSPALMSWVKAVGGDGTYAIPNQPYAVMWFYNKEHFSKAGIKTPPKTWDEFLEDCALLKKAGFIPMTVDDAYIDILSGAYLNRLKGSDWISAAMKDKTAKVWKDPAVLQFAKAYQELHDKGYISDKVASNKYPAGQQQMALGEVSMYLNGTWFPSEVAGTAGPDFKWGEFSTPTVPNGIGKTSEITYGANSYMINKKSKNPEAAFELLKYIASKKSQSAFSDKCNTPPVTIDTKWPAAIADCADAFNSATKNDPWGDGAIDGGDFYKGTWAPAITDLLSGKIKAEQFVDKIYNDSIAFYKNK